MKEARGEMVDRVVGPKSVVVSTNTDVDVWLPRGPAKAPMATMPRMRKLAANMFAMLAAQ